VEAWKADRLQASAGLFDQETPRRSAVRIFGAVSAAALLSASG
jgi:hypothetical protein